MTTESWEVWYPKAGATGLLLARGLTDTAESILVHSAPEIVTVEVRDPDGRRLAFGEDLKRTLESPICRMRRAGDAIIRDDLWPTEEDLESTVLFPGGEVDVLKTWWHSDDHMQWRWQVEFYNAIDSGVTTAPAVGEPVANGARGRPRRRIGRRSWAPKRTGHHSPKEVSNASQ